MLSLQTGITDDFYTKHELLSTTFTRKWLDQYIFLLRLTSIAKHYFSFLDIQLQTSNFHFTFFWHWLSLDSDEFDSHQ